MAYIGHFEQLTLWSLVRLGDNAKGSTSRGGRRRKYDTLEPAGARALQESHDTLRLMAKGVPARIRGAVDEGR